MTMDNINSAGLQTNVKGYLEWNLNKIFLNLRISLKFKSKCFAFNSIT